MTLRILLFVCAVSLLSIDSAAAYTSNDSAVVVPDTKLPLDTLSTYWYNKQMSYGNDTSFLVNDADSNFNPIFPDSVYIDRLNQLPMVFELSFNKIVRNYIHMYSSRRRDLVEQMLGLSDYYFPIFEQVLDANNMPLELKYLPVIESALNPNAVSKAGATGMWQFMFYTGKAYKLEISSFVDERRDPIEASQAAANFLQDLYNMYHDWVLVIAAYNCGPGNVNKAIRRSGGKKDYWEIYYRLPKETRGYVPAFIAAAYIMNYHAEHNLYPKKCDLPILCDTIMINERVHFEQISHFMDISVAELQSLNPQYRRDIIPQGKPYALRLPFDKTNRFIDAQDSIFGYNDSVYFNPEKLSKTPQLTSYNPGPPSSSHVKLVYTVKSGDNLGFIAEWYDVRLSDVRYWNGIRGNTIRSGQKLRIYKPKNKVAKYQSIDDMTFTEKQATKGKTVSAKKTPTPLVAENLSEGEYDIYVIRNGDTLWDIAKLYPGVTDTDIMRWNGISNAGKISVGQKLKIKKI